MTGQAKSQASAFSLVYDFSRMRFESKDMSKSMLEKGVLMQYLSNSFLKLL
jgi:hypothetical protein